MELEELWRVYAETGAGPEAPTYRALAHAVAADPDLLEVAAAAPPATHHPNHLLGAVRFLLMGGLTHPLAQAYAGDDLDATIREFRAFVLEHRGQILDVLETRRVQTNEVGRVAVIAPALVHVASEVQQPIALLDVGTSAGLNLLVDRCRIDYGDFVAGPDDAGLGVTCELAGPLAPFGPADLDISWRMGLDRSPVDITDEASARWLRSCVWVDHPDRMERLALAIEQAQAHPAPIMAGDAVADLPPALHAAPGDAHLVVLTSWVAFYLSKEQRRAFEGVLRHAGRPLTWISLEHPGVVDVPAPPTPPEHQVAPSAIGAVRFDGGTAVERTFLGWAHPHGRWLHWQA